jgi:hypothetical protein
MSLEVAKTIVEQLGGRQFMAMTGVKSFVGNENGVSFRMPRANHINVVRITLTPMDVYEVTFLYVTIKGSKTIAVEQDVYAEDLQRLFTRHTGLDTHL